MFNSYEKVIHTSRFSIIAFLNQQQFMLCIYLWLGIVTRVPGTYQRRPGNGENSPARNHRGLIGPS